MSTQQASKSQGATRPTPLRLDDTGAEGANGDATPSLRRFHVTGRGAPAELPAGLVPALLHPLRDPSRVRDGYPLFVPATSVPPSGEAEGDAFATTVASVTDLLRGAFERAFSGADGKIIGDNLDRLELAIRREVAEKAVPVDVGKTLEMVGTTMLAGLGLPEGAAAEAREALGRLLEHVPPGRFVGCDGRTPLHLVTLAKEHASDARYREARAALEEIRDQLTVRLDVDRAKSAAGRTSDRVGKSLGAGTGSLLEPSAVASLMGRVRGSVPMPDDRRKRMEGALETIERFLDTHVDVETRLVTTPGRDLDVDAAHVHVEVTEDPLAAAHDRALESAASVLGLCRAVRLARLELESRYDPARHDEWLAALGSESLEDEERALLPPILVLVDTDDIEERWISALSSVLRSPWPITVVSITTPLRALGPDRGIDIGYFGIGHRRAFVQQSSISRPVHLYEGLLRALGPSRPSLHVVDTGETREGAGASIGRWLRAGAAIEARVHPLFRFDPAAGSDWASRFDLGDNPEPDEPWSTAELTVERDGDEPLTLSTAFTLADLSLLEPALAPELALVPAAESDALVTVEAYLEMTREERPGHVPYVWAADESGRLVRVAVTERLCRAVEERRDLWHTLQELAGIRSTYVERAEARVRERVEADAAERLQRADAEHAEAIEQARNEAAGEALDGLARYLLDMDGDLVLGGGTAGVAMPATPAAKPAGAPTGAPEAPEAEATEATEAPAEAPEEAEEEDEAGFEDPWIETALCTSCNDCTNINPKLFVYDGNKQAHIGDPDAGTFAELVQAAEKCPARCIHPGKPRNSDEPNLDELVRRAAPFNK